MNYNGFIIINQMTISAPYEAGSSSGTIDEASDIKMADFMMDGAYLHQRFCFV